MGYNSKVFDQEKYYSEKSFSELMQLREKTEKFIEEHPQFAYGSLNEHLHFLKLKMAERIGNKS